MAEPHFKVSVVIPAYNEEAVIEPTVRALSAALAAAGLAHEIRVVDDQSSDSTWAILSRLSAEIPEVKPVRNQGKGGYGLAVRAGLSSFEGDAVIVSMADGSDSPSDVVAYAQALTDGYDCAFGNRFSGQTQVQDYPLVKKMLNRAGNLLIAYLTGFREYRDFTNGFKGYRRHVVEAMAPLISADFNLTVEMSVKAVLSGASAKIIPNSWRDRDGGVSKFNVGRLGPRYLATIAYCVLGDYIRRAGARERKQAN
jgi:dolichol-phosphate mannosyltransferase